MKRALLAASLLLGALGAGRLACAPEPVALATFNIRMFPEPSTNHARLAELIAEVDADILAVQEIRDEDALNEVLRSASLQSGRDYRLSLATCGGSANIATGLVYDVSRVELVGLRQFKEHHEDDRGDCAKKRRAALLGIFEAQGQTVAVLSVHMQHGHLPEQYEARKRQWAGVVRILQEAAERHEARAVALGDFNSTGYADEPREERAFIEKTIQDAGLHLATEGIACTEYWRPYGEDGIYQPSILDHIVVTDAAWSTPEPLGLCAQLACQPAGPEQKPADYHTVSDHCPIRITLE